MECAKVHPLYLHCVMGVTMSGPYAEIWKLCDCLEAQLEGRPIDASLVKDLAARLGENFPGIRNSMTLLSQRAEEDAQMATATAA